MNTYRESTYRVLTGLLRVSLIVSMVIALTFSAAAGIPLGVKPAYAATIIVTNANDSGATSHTQTRADLPPAAPTAATPCDTNVAETSQYSVVYQMNIPANADYNTGSPAYSIDNTATTPAFDRVGYCLQLDGNWVWVSMDAFTTVPGRIGVPVASTGATFQQTVTNMNVASNVAGVTTGTGITTGNIEFWHHCYATGPVLGLPGNNSGLYDFDDNPGGQADSCYGSMQVHNYGVRETIFAWNAWDNTQDDGLGIGNNPGAQPDWTFQQNAGSYTTRTLSVYVRRPLVAPGAAGGNGPGGVGYIDPASSLQVWLRADRGVYTDAGCSTTPAANGNNVRCWQDQSGKNRNATQSTAAYQPVYQTSVINGQPSVRFGGATDDDYLNIDLNFLWNGSNNQNYTIFGVTDRRGVKTENYFLGTNASAVNRGLHIGYRTDTAYALAQYSNDIDVVVPNSSGLQFNIAAGWYNNTVGHAIYINHNQYSNSNTNTIGFSTATAPGTVGRGYNTTSTFDGDVTEVIMYTLALNNTDRILVENYLSAKYNVALGANDVYDGDTAYDFDLDMAGIGRFGGNNHTQSHSAGIIVVDRTFLQDNGDWLTFGHRTATAGRTPNDLPTTGDWASAPAPQRWARHWYFDRTDVGTLGGTVDIIFDFSEGNMNGNSENPAGPASNYRLLRRGDAETQFSDIATASAIVGDQVQFLGVDVTLLGSNFTLGTLDDANSPTAIGLQSFEAVPVDQTSARFVPIGLGAILLILSGTVLVINCKRR